ncbi:unnamed protein product [Musa hybrid cultivar]
MGACVSSEAAAVVAASGTAKVILPDGGLREYTRPVTALRVLGKDAARFFVCDADGMEFEGLVSAVGAHEELRPGQLYFVLPRKMLSRPLHAEELAALAVKASAALVGAVAPLVFPAGTAGEEKGRRTRRGGGGGGKFAADLSGIHVIPSPAKASHGNFVEIPTVTVTPPAVLIEPGCRTRATRRIGRRVTRPLYKLAASLSVSSYERKKERRRISRVDNKRSAIKTVIASSSAMGGCNSCYAAAVVVDGTAKVVLPDGGLREYTRPVTAAHALGKDAACFFVCDADAMEFDAFVSAVGAEEELRPGQLYFVLPRTMLKYPLRAEDVAALALKASDALMGAAGRGAPGPLVFPLEQEDATGGELRVQDEKGKRRIRRGGGGGGSRKFTPDLSVIPE